jgi:hypothetical protein
MSRMSSAAGPAVDAALVAGDHPGVLLIGAARNFSTPPGLLRFDS